MHCPEHIVFNRWRLMVTMYWMDVPRHLIPLRVWLNPLRYEILLRMPERNRVLRLNPNGRWAYAYSNWWWRRKLRRERQ